MSFQMAFHKYSCFLQEKLKTHHSQHEWISQELSSEQPDGSWRLVGAGTDTLVATVWVDGSCEFRPLGGYK
tara:strand:- start:756 stop:968 length:213 start_codon:yes stop_codon:yes gene_type:complete